MWNIDFLPERIKAQRLRRTRLVKQGYLLAACAVVLVVVGYVRHNTVASAKAELLLVKGRDANMQRQLETRKQLERRLAELMVNKRIDDTLGSRVVAVDVLAELNRLTPESVALTNLSMETMVVNIPIRAVGGRGGSGRAISAGAGKRHKKIKRLRLVVTGLAPGDVDVANFIGQLSASPVFEEINMGRVRTVNVNRRKAREFQVACYVVR